MSKNNLNEYDASQFQILIDLGEIDFSRIDISSGDFWTEYIRLMQLEPGIPEKRTKILRFIKNTKQ